jgi:hypothetical protein
MSEEKLLKDTTCDTLNLTYTTGIQIIFETNCYTCHSNTVQSGGFNCEDTVEIHDELDNAVLISSIKGLPGYSQMPKDRDKLPECLIKKIEVWNREGRKN